jgi:hypothetical protein
MTAEQRAGQSGDDAPIDDQSALELVGLPAEGLEGVGAGELRSSRDRAVATETGLSYLRRMVQGPLDMVRGELTRRANGETGDLSTLVDDLPRILSEHAGPGGGRLPQTLEPTEVDPELAGELEQVTQGGLRVASVPTASDAELDELATELDGLERRVSRKRRTLHRTIDLLNAELARRYSSGELTPETALAETGPDGGDRPAR